MSEEIYLILAKHYQGPLIVGGNLGAIPNFATEKEQKRNFLDFTDVTLVVVDIKSERFIKYVFTGLV